jgi:hypothetical protein
MLLPTDWRKYRTSVSEEDEKHGALSPGAKSDPVQRNDLAPQLRLLAGSEGRFTDQLVADELAETIASADLVRGYQPLAARLLLQEQGREPLLAPYRLQHCPLVHRRPVRWVLDETERSANRERRLACPLPPDLLPHRRPGSSAAGLASGLRRQPGA